MKKHTTVSLDVDLLNLAKTHNLNLSECLSEKIREKVHLPDVVDIQKQMTALKSQRELLLSQAKGIAEQHELLERKLSFANSSMERAKSDSKSFIEQNMEWLEDFQGRMNKYYYCFRNKADGQEKWHIFKKHFMERFGLTEDDAVKFAEGYLTIEAMVAKAKAEGNL